MPGLWQTCHVLLSFLVKNAFTVKDKIFITDPLDMLESIIKLNHRYSKTIQELTLSSSTLHFGLSKPTKIFFFYKYFSIYF